MERFFHMVSSMMEQILIKNLHKEFGFVEPFKNFTPSIGHK